MANQAIISGGKEYPCYPTMGAMLRYKRLTNKEYNQGDGTISDALTRLYCLACSASEAEGAEKPADLQSFCNGISPEVFNQWAMAQAEGEKETEGEKKD